MTTGRTTADVIAREIRRHRQAQGLTVKQLADDCARLGAAQLTATALTNIERGQGESGKGGRPRTSESAPRRRRDVSHDELLVIARALRIPPALLIFPVGTGEQVEALPGQNVSAWAAYKWFTGFEPLAGHETDAAEWQKGALPLIAHREHDRLVDLWHRAAMDAENNRQMAESAISDEGRAEFGAEADQAGRQARAAEYQLAQYRRYMRRHDVTPDPLPDKLKHVDELPAPKAPPMPRTEDLDASRRAIRLYEADKKATAHAQRIEQERARSAGNKDRVRELDEQFVDALREVARLGDEMTANGIVPPARPKAWTETMVDLGLVRYLDRIAVDDSFASSVLHYPGGIANV